MGLGEEFSCNSQWNSPPIPVALSVTPESEAQHPRELVRNTDSQAASQTYWNRNSEGGAVF